METEVHLVGMTKRHLCRLKLIFLLSLFLLANESVAEVPMRRFAVPMIEGD